MFVYYKSAHKTKIAQNYIVGIQIKLVHEILSQDLKLLLRNFCGPGVLILRFVGVYLYVHVFVNCGISHCGWVLNMWVPKIFLKKCRN